MKLRKRFIVNVALKVLDERGMVTQYDIHTAIEEILNRQLSLGEKIRVTRVLKENFSLKEVKRDFEGIRIYIFEK